MDGLTADQRRFLDEARAEADALRSSPSFPAADVDGIHRAVGRLRSGGGAEDLRRAVARVAHVARTDADVPTTARNPLARVAKAVIRRALGWYLLALGRRLAALGAAVADLGAALTDRVTSLEERVEALERERAGRP
ncbi:MAG TPA: hypothetical protein VGB14_09945 [Acidimicrobiales bacterium]